MRTNAIETNGLGRDFGRTPALDKFSIDIRPGRVVALLGANGAGKTTLLRLLLGLIEPTRGQARVLGAPARDKPADVCGRIAGVGEGHDPPRWARLTMLRRLQADASPRFDRRVFDDLCSRRELPLRKPFGVLSKGQRRWVLSALALASGADLILMDEPADGLDPAARREVYDHVRQYVNEREATVLVATHIIGDIERVTDDVAIIHHGRLLLHDELEDLREQVREIEFARPPESDDWCDGVETIMTKQAHGAFLAWVRCRQTQPDELQQRLAPQAAVRPATLESLYLAVAEGEREDSSQTKEAN